MSEIELKLKCPKCDKEFTIKCTQSQFNKGRYRKFCSRTCANSRIFSQESIEKKRKSALEYIKRHNIIKQPKQYTCKYCGKIFYSNDTRDVGEKIIVHKSANEIIMLSILNQNMGDIEKVQD